jgi:hypothetical protein
MLTLDNQVPLATNGGDFGAFQVSGYDADCVPAAVEVSLYVTTATDLSVHTNPVITLSHEGSHSAILLEPVRQGVSLRGGSLGSGCLGERRLTFRLRAPAFTTATPPYAGAFAPAGDLSGFLDDGFLGIWRLTFTGLDETVTVHCRSIAFTLRQHAP